MHISISIAISIYLYLYLYLSVANIKSYVLIPFSYNIFEPSDMLGGTGVSRTKSKGENFLMREHSFPYDIQAQLAKVMSE